MTTISMKPTLLVLLAATASASQFYMPDTGETCTIDGANTLCVKGHEVCLHKPS